MQMPAATMKSCSTMSKSSPCPICHGSHVAVIEDRAQLPIAQNVVYPSRTDAVHCPLGQLHIVGCHQCGFVWNAAFSADLMKYDADYNNDVSESAFYCAHIDAMADRILSDIGQGEKVRLVEVGCGQGDFLTKLAQRLGDRLEWAMGFDPSWRGKIELPARVQIIAEYFGAAQLPRLIGKANVIVSRHTIEHVPDPIDFLKSIKGGILDDKTQLYIETPCVEWILNEVAVYDFYYEHCSLFSVSSLTWALQACGFQSDISHVYAGQYLWARAHLTQTLPAQVPATHASALFDAYIDQRARFVAQWRRVLADTRPGGLAIWGAASKGVTFALLFNDDDRRVAVAIDLNKNKQQKYMALSGVEIISPESAATRGLERIVVMNPNYAQEIRNLCHQLGMDCDVMSL